MIIDGDNVCSLCWGWVIAVISEGGLFVLNGAVVFACSVTIKIEGVVLNLE